MGIINKEYTKLEKYLPTNGEPQSFICDRLMF